MKKNLLERVAFVIFVALIAIPTFVVSALAGSRKDIDLTSSYKKIECKASSLIILNEVNVRAEPKVLSDRSDGDTNSFGLTKKAGFDVRISKFYKTNVQLDNNGEFYGFLVKEIQKTTEGTEWFPKGIKDDKDGIIWISSEYVALAS